MPPFLKGKLPEGFKFLPIEYTDKLEYYAPAYLEHADYPALIPQGQQIATISVPAVLAVYDWPKNTDRYQRLDARRRLSLRALREAAEGARLPREVEGREPRRQRAGLDSASSRCRTGSTRPRSSSARSVDPAQLRAQAARAAPNDPAEQERLFRQFLEWNRKQSKQ